VGSGKELGRSGEEKSFAPPTSVHPSIPEKKNTTLSFSLSFEDAMWLELHQVQVFPLKYWVLSCAEEQI
jgi:hypothetical protein